MDMNINQLNYTGTFQAARQPVTIGETPQQQTPQLSDSVDFSDGINNAVEIALLPNVDGILGQVVSAGDKLKSGEVAHVSGRITTDNDTKQLGKIDYEMSADLTSGVVSIKGAILSDPEKNVGVFITENAAPANDDAFAAKIEGVVSTDAASTRVNENLKISVGLGSFSTEGTVNGIPVTHNTQVGFLGDISYEGNIADKSFERQLISDFSNDTVSIKGKLGDMEETGSITMTDNGLLIDRQIGPYHIQETVTFTPNDAQ